MIITKADIIGCHEHEITDGSVVAPAIAQLDDIAAMLGQYTNALASYRGKICLGGYSVQIYYKKPDLHLTLFLASDSWIHFVSSLDKKDDCHLDSCHIDSSEIGFAIDAAVAIKRDLEA